MLFEVWSVKLKEINTWNDAQKEIERHAKVSCKHPLVIHHWVLRPNQGAQNRIMAVLMFDSMTDRIEFFKNPPDGLLTESMNHLNESGLFVNDSWEMHQYYGPQIK